MVGVGQAPPALQMPRSAIYKAPWLFSEIRDEFAPSRAGRPAAGFRSALRRRPGRPGGAVLARPAHDVLCDDRETGGASVRRWGPWVATVSAAKCVENRTPLRDDPIFRRFFGNPGGPREQIQLSLGS